MSLLSDIKLNNNILEETSEFCNVRLVTSNKLCWNAHVDNSGALACEARQRSTMGKKMK